MPSSLTGLATVSCHVELPLDDAAWAAFSRFQRRRPGGFPVAALMRPPAPEDGEQEVAWLRRAREAAARGPFGHHTHWGGVSQARPLDGDPAERVLREGRWLRERGLEPRFFCGGGWYLDGEVAAAVAELGYVDATATSFRQSYLEPGAPRVEAREPVWLRLADGRRLLELPATHSVGALVRSLHRSLPPVVHVHFHDWDLLDRKVALALELALRVLRLRRRPVGLDELARLAAGRAPEVPFAAAAGVESVAGGQAGSHAGDGV